MKPAVARLLAVAAAMLLGGYLLVAGIAEELPVGSVSGQVVMKENQRPLADAYITVRAIGAPEEDLRQSFRTTTDAAGHFRFRQLPAGEYRISTSTEAHRVNDLRVSVEEGKNVPLKLAAVPVDPYLNLYASQKVFSPGEAPSVDVSAFNPDHLLSLSVFRIDLAKVAGKQGYEAAMRPVASGNQVPVTAVGVGEKVFDQAITRADLDAEGRYVKTMRLGKLPEGSYLVYGTDETHRATAVIFVSRIAMVTKSSPLKTLCYVTDLVSGVPIAGASISAPIFDSKDGKLRAVATTNAEGIAEIAVPAKSDGPMMLLARSGPSLALVGAGIPQVDKKSIFITTYCERPAYRPGDSVNFKGFVRRRAPDGYALPGPGTVTVTIKDPDDNDLTTLRLPLSIHGSFHGSFATSSEAKPGGYIVQASAFGATNSDTYANIVAYRKPEFSIEVKPTRDHFTMGDQASATVECQYYYGGPVVGAKISATIYRSPAFRYGDEDGESQLYSDAGEYSQEVEAVTDASGRANIQFPTRSDNDPSALSNDYIYTVYANVSETDGRAFNGSGEIRVVRGDYNLELEVQNPVVYVGQAVQLKVRTTDSTRCKIAAPAQKVTVRVGSEKWVDNQPQFTEKQSFQVETDAKGEANLTIPITKAESLAIRAVSTDSHGREIVANEYAYVAGAAQDTTPQPGNLKITLDHREYQAGQTAKALLQTDLPGGSALVCVQTDRILWEKVVPLTSAATLVEVPMSLSFAPNVYLTAVYVREKQFLEASKRVRVDRQDRRLKIEVTSDAKTYLPGGKVKLNVRTLLQGKPVAAEVSVGVVDQGVYDISPDSTNLYAALYPERYDQVQTAYSFPEVYLDGGDKGTSKVPFRKNFRDTAAWLPAVWTGSTGTAQVEVTLPDNLTGWRVTVVGLTDQSEAGMSTGSFQAKKPLMVRLGLPQFLVEGDQMRLTAVIANDEAETAKVNLHLSGQGLTLAGPTDSTLDVSVGTPQTQAFDVTAGEFGAATIGAQAASRQTAATDGVQKRIKILPFGRTVTTSRSGEGSAVLDLKELTNLNPRFGGLTIQMSPSLAGNLVKSLDGLIDFPYGCTEQTMSRFMPSILVERAVKRLGISAPPRLANLPAIVRDSLTRLAQMRHYDGGWGWWEYDESEPFMTALVLDGLARAKEAGYDVRIANPSAAADWAVKYLSAKNEMSDRDRIYLIYASLAWGKKDAIKFLDAIELRDRTITVNQRPQLRPQTGELAIAALAYQRAGQPEKANKLVSHLVTRADIGIETASWTEEDESWGQEPTALALVALEAIRPSDPIIPKVVRYLMQQRQGNGWTSTRDTAYAIIGLSAYLERSQELASPSSVSVTLNGRLVKTVKLDPARLTDPGYTINIPRSLLPTAPMKLSFAATGKGRAYYSVQLSGLETGSDLPPASTDNGLSIARSYYRMEARTMENGEQKLLPSLKPVTQFQSGDLIRVVLTIRSDRARSFILVNEPTPSACRVTEREDLADGEDWSWWWSRTVILDDHLAFFARHLPKGESKITYNMRAEQIGRVRALPSSVCNMYDPGRWASGAAESLEVRQ